MQHLRIVLNQKSDTLYVEFSDQPISHTYEYTRDVLFDLAEDNTIVGVDIQHASEVLSGDVDSMVVPGASLVPQQLASA